MNATEAAYRRYWATLTGKSEREIYVPLALRQPKEVAEGRAAVQVSLDRRG